MNLLPGRIAAMADMGMFDRCREYFALNCIECGECAVVCPAKRHLVQLIRYSKLQIMNQKNETVEATE
jgi:H+/Na+-translocating ferredoxin:NAD+ oxidoreductase subunit C